MKYKIQSNEDNKLSNDFIRIMNCFTCSDGGVLFMKLRLYLESLNDEDIDQKKILDVVNYMSNLIKMVDEVVAFS